MSGLIQSATDEENVGQGALPCRLVPEQDHRAAGHWAPAYAETADDAFGCLYRRYCGGPAPAESHRQGPLPWGNPDQVRRIAVLRPGQLGDLLLAIPGLWALRRHFAAAEITLITQPWAAGLPERFPWLDRVLTLSVPVESWDAQGNRQQARALSPSFFPGNPGAACTALTLGARASCPPASQNETERPEREGPGNALESFVEEARGYGYDLVLQLQGDSLAHARFALALGGRVTAGFCREAETAQDFHLLLPMPREEPEVLRVLRLAHALGAPPEAFHLGFPLLERDREELEGVAELRETLERRPVVVLHPGARPPARRWPLERFAALAGLLRRRWEATLVLVGGPEEVALVEEVREKSEVPALNVAGRLSLGGLAALLSRVDLFVGNDSGPAQLAAATAPRSLRIFGPANRRRWAPLDRAHHRIVYRQVECSPCDHWDCPIDHRCLQWIGVEEVLAEAEILLSLAVDPPQYPMGQQRDPSGGHALLPELPALPGGPD